jgi:hypothetical protein
LIFAVLLRRHFLVAIGTSEPSPVATGNQKKPSIEPILLLLGMRNNGNMTRLFACLVSTYTLLPSSVFISVVEKAFAHKDPALGKLRIDLTHTHDDVDASKQSGLITVIPVDKVDSGGARRLASDGCTLGC